MGTNCHQLAYHQPACPQLACPQLACPQLACPQLACQETVVSTIDLVNELLNRYDEILIIACTTRDNQPTVDINTKIKNTLDNGVLAGILTRILHSLT